MRTDPFWRRLRSEVLTRRAAALSQRLGESVEAGKLLYSEQLAHWVYPVRGPWLDDGTRFVARCVALYLYDEKGDRWYASYQSETLEHYHALGKSSDRPAESAGPLGNPDFF